MADNFGTRQTRVLTVADRNLDNVIFQYRTPALTSEWNLINQIGNEKAQNLARLSCPSGWLNVGDILQDWADADVQTGQVNCSATYDADTFKLFSRNGCRAIVNGWPLLIQGSNSSNDDNIIQLNPPEGQIYDFVFLEVWRKLIAATDPIYPYGNVLASPYADNEVEWAVMGTETTKRVQIQYRIRSATIDDILTPDSNMSDMSDIHPIGGRTTGEYPYYTFRKYGPSDAGLYISGDGTSTSETLLNTVDGYVYAIPMFLVYRRIESDDIFTATSIKKAFVNLQDNIAGYRSDRPDGSLSDVIYKDDIVDFRHKILTSGKELDITLQQSVSKLVAGELATALKRGFSDDGSITSASSGGSTLMKVERINGGADDIPELGTGSGITSTTFKRRAFCNAEIEHDHNVIEIPHPVAWVVGDTFDPEALLTLPDGEIVSVDGFYDGTLPITDITPATPCAPTVFTVGGGHATIIMEYTFKYSSSTAGFKDVPKELLEAGKGTFLPIATRDNDVPLRFNSLSSPELLNFGASVSQPGYPGEISSSDFLRYRGGNYTEKSNFGHEMVAYRTTNGAGIVTLTLTNSMLGGYCILGVKSVELQSAIGVPVAFTVARQVTTSPYAITAYTVTATGHLNVGIRVILYVGSKFIQTYGDAYSIGESLKFFETNKQGRGVVDTYEMIEVIAKQETVGGSDYFIDTNDKPIIAYATAVDLGGVTQAFAFQYNIAGSNSSINIVPYATVPVLSSAEYSVSSLPTKVKISAASTDAYLRVPVLVHSYVAQSETPYNFFYKTNAYQGILTSTSAIYGKVVDEGPALITTLGSGAVVDYSYSTGHAQISISGKIVTGITDGTNLPQWLSYAKANDYIRITGDTRYYRILSVDSDTQLTLAEFFEGASQLNAVYDIKRLDVPNSNISNVVDRMPSLKNLSGTSDGVEDHLCYSDGTILRMVQAQFRSQDPLLTLTNDFKLGNSGAERGRTDFRLTVGANDIYKLSSTPRPHVFYESTVTLSTGHYKKVYQVYLFNRSEKGGSTPDLTGRVYMLVVSGEKKSLVLNMLDGMLDLDTVDLFEMVGRPLIKFD